MRVIWDTKKAATNIRDHGIEFSHAATVLDDPMAVTIEDRRHGEQRFVTIGADLLARVLIVVYAYSGEEEIRLISARRATPRERRVYEKKDEMLGEYDFSKGKRGSVISHKDKTRITIFIDTDILEWFRNEAEREGQGYQTSMNQALRNYIKQDKRSIQEIVREAVRKELSVLKKAS